MELEKIEVVFDVVNKDGNVVGELVTELTEAGVIFRLTPSMGGELDE